MKVHRESIPMNLLFLHRKAVMEAAMGRFAFSAVEL